MKKINLNKETAYSISSDEKKMSESILRKQTEEKDLNEFISIILNELSDIPITEIPTNSSETKSFCIDEIQQTFSISCVPYERFIFRYKFAETSQLSNVETKFDYKKFAKVVARNIYQKYEVCLYQNTNKYKKFIKKIEALIGIEIVQNLDNIKFIPLINDHELMFSVPISGRYPFSTYYKDPMGNDYIIFNNHKTQKSLFETLRLLYGHQNN